MRYELKVNRAELAEGLNRLRKLAKPKTNMEAVLSFEKGMFLMYLNGVTIQATAEGELPGLIRITGTRAINLSKILPTDNPLLIALEDERVSIGSLTIPCTWVNAEPHPVQLSIDPPLTELLGAKLKYTEQEIFTSGLSNPVNDAEAQRKRLIRRAANVLEPLGVRLADVEQLVDSTLRRINNL